MNRRELLQLSVFGAASAAAAGGEAKDKGGPPPPFEHAGKTVKQLQAACKDGALTSAQLTAAYQARIELLKPELHSTLEVNPDALRIAEALDLERKEKGVRGPLHGIPVLVKDNIDTGDKQQTTAGSLALAGTPAKSDAFVVKKLRDAGAVILGKANMSEWANMRSTRGTSGWSARGGQSRNPYALDRSPIGSSSGCGVALAADLCALAIGTETDGSIVAPCSAMALVGLKPTVGLVSRTGVIPISQTQDTIGPMGRTVEDVATLLGAMTGFDAEDLGMRGSGRKALDEYAKSLGDGGVAGKRLGVARKLFGQGPQVQKVLEAAVADLQKLGAVIVDIELPRNDFEAEMEVLLTEMKAGLEEYLKKRRPDAAVQNLADVIAFNEKNAEREMPFFGQELLLQAQSKGSLQSAAYKKALEACRKRARKEGCDLAIVKHKLDAVVTGTMDPAWVIDPLLGDPWVAAGYSLPAIAGYPSLTVPAGNVGGLPIGLLFFGAPYTEQQLLRFAYAYEQATNHRKPPTFAPTATPRY